MAYQGKLLSVDPNPTRKGKERWKVQIDVATASRGLAEFSLWNTRLMGRSDADGNPPICNLDDLVGESIVFDADPGKPKENGAGTWPPTLTMVQVTAGASPTADPSPPAHDPARPPASDEAYIAWRNALKREIKAEILTEMRT